MLPEIITATLLVLPLISLLTISIKYWIKFRDSEKNIDTGKKANYKQPYYFLLFVGDLLMWVFWIVGIVFMFLDQFFSVFAFMTFSGSNDTLIQVTGLVIFYLGAITYNLNIIYAGKNLRPSTSGLLENHELVQKGPFRIIRYPLYTSYLIIHVGLMLTLLAYWLVIPVLCLTIGIYPTAKAEEELLIERFGEEYIKYKRKVGMFLPKLF